jgi:L-serine dehydratase
VSGVFDIFRIGLGPSSSHTVGPMRAAAAFMQGLPANARPHRLEVTLYGSLAWTGQGHGTAPAIMGGLLGWAPETAEPEALRALPALLRDSGRLVLPWGGIAFDPGRDIRFDRESKVPDHPNALRLRAFGAEATLLRDELWFSVGGGSVRRAGEKSMAALSCPFASGVALLERCAATGQSIAALQFAHDSAHHGADAVRAHLHQVAATMRGCIERGLVNEGELPGGLKVRRRAPGLAVRLASRNTPGPTEAMDRASLWAMAVNEENAAGGRVVTAPTNGAAGVVPAVLRWAREHLHREEPSATEDFLLTAAAIGGLIKANASVSGAEVGCQGEVGSAAAMAAAGLAALMGGTPEQIENAAEIALEHHLGMTCDPIGGLVQIPCIERNAMGAVKAINAASLALAGDGAHHVSLDEAIATMRQTGLDMRSEYKETSRGGLAVHVAEC